MPSVGHGRGGAAAAALPANRLDAAARGAVDDPTRDAAKARTTGTAMQGGIDALAASRAAAVATGQGIFNYDLLMGACKGYFLVRSLMLDCSNVRLVGDGASTNLGVIPGLCIPAVYIGVRRDLSTLTSANFPTLAGVLDSTATTSSNGNTRHGLLLGGSGGWHIAPEFSGFSLGTAPGIKGPCWGKWGNENAVTISFGFDLGSTGWPAGSYVILGQVGVASGWAAPWVFYPSGLAFTDSAGIGWYAGGPESGLAGLTGVVAIEYRINLATATVQRSIGTKASAGAATTWGAPLTIPQFAQNGSGQVWDVGHVGGRTFATAEDVTHGLGNAGGKCYNPATVPAAGIKLLFYKVTNVAPTVASTPPPAADLANFADDIHTIALLPMDDAVADALADLQVGVVTGSGANGSFFGPLRGNAIYRSRGHDDPGAAISGAGLLGLSVRSNGSYGAAVAVNTTTDSTFRDVCLHGGACGLAVGGNVDYTTRLDGQNTIGGAYCGLHQYSESGILKQTGVLQIDAWGQSAIESPYAGGWDLDYVYVTGVPPSGRYLLNIDGSLSLVDFISDGETGTGAMKAGIRVRPAIHDLSLQSYCHLGRIGINGLNAGAPAIQLAAGIDGSGGTPASFRLESLTVFGAASLPELVEIQSDRWVGALTCPVLAPASVVPAMKYTGAAGRCNVTWTDPLNYAGRPAAGTWFERGYTIRPNVPAAIVETTCITPGPAGTATWLDTTLDGTKMGT